MEELSQNQLDGIYQFIKRYVLVLAVGSLGLILLGIGLIQYFSSPKEEVEFVSNTENEAKLSSSLFVDVEGEVQNPGLYELKEGSRIHDAIIMAGGFSEEADRHYIAQFLNLAKKVEDGAKVYIPRKPENSDGQVAGTYTSNSTTAVLININTATAHELESLSGVGTVTAEKIIGGRPYSSVEELVSKKIVGQKTFEKIQDSISVY